MTKTMLAGPCTQFRAGFMAPATCGECSASLAHITAASASLTKPIEAMRNPARAASGQRAKLLRHQGSAARRPISSKTRACRSCGARRAGCARKVRSMSASSLSILPLLDVMASAVQASVYDARPRKFPRKRQAAALHVGLHFRKRDAELSCDVLIGHVFKVVQHERHALVRGQIMQRPVNDHTALGGVDVRQRRVRHGELEFTFSLIVHLGAKLGEQSPGLAVA